MMAGITDTMTQSESIQAIAKALVAAHAQMPSVPFDATNPFLHNDFASLGSVIATARPILAKHGLAIMQFACSNEPNHIGVRTRLVHSSGEWLEESIYLPIAEEKGKSTAQVAGSIITYLRRYAQSALLNLYADADTDGNALPAPKPSSNAPATVPPASAPTRMSHAPKAETKEAKAVPVASDPEKKAQACKAKFLKVITDNKWMFYAWQYGLNQSWIMPNERLEEGNANLFPQTAEAFAKAEEGIKALMDEAAARGGPTQEQQEAYDSAHLDEAELESASDNDGGAEPWMDVVMHFGPDKGKRLIDIDSKKRWGWAKNYQPKAFKGRLNPADEALRAALDEALSWMQENKG